MFTLISCFLKFYVSNHIEINVKNRVELNSVESNVKINDIMFRILI